MQDLVKYIENIRKTLRSIKISDTNEAIYAIKFMEQYCEHILPYLVTLRGKSPDIFFQYIDWLFFYNTDLADAAKNSLHLPTELSNGTLDFIDVIEKIAESIINSRDNKEIKNFLSAQEARANSYLFLAAISFAIVMVVVILATISSGSLAGIIVLAVFCGMLAALFPAALSYKIKRDVALFDLQNIENNLGNYHNDICKEFEYLSRRNIQRDVETIELKEKDSKFFSQGLVTSYQKTDSRTDMDGFTTEYDDGTRVFVSGLKKCEIFNLLRSKNGLFKANPEESICTHFNRINVIP